MEVGRTKVWCISTVVDPAISSVVTASHTTLAGNACGPVPVSGSMIATDAATVPSPIYLSAASTVWLKRT